MEPIDRQFTRAIVLGPGIAAAVAYWLGYPGMAVVSGGVAGFHLLAALCFKPLIPWSRRVFGWVFSVLGRTIATALLTLFYYLVLTPFSLIWKLAGKDDLRRVPPNWHRIPDQENDPERLKRMF